MQLASNAVGVPVSELKAYYPLNKIFYGVSSPIDYPILFL